MFIANAFVLSIFLIGFVSFSGKCYIFPGEGQPQKLARPVKQISTEN